ncbi:cytochrome P450 [Sorangium sp. So ce854]|uniref:cytochrome P450 n=1 Tax=Sorangium sp. So ce854 TaxID=3133322 RepID=UPI003F5FDD9C
MKFAAIDLSTEAFERNPWPVYSALRARDPIHWSEENRTFYLSKFRHVRQAMTSPDFTAEYPFRASRMVLGRTVLDLEGASHQRLRGLTSACFKPIAVESYAREVIAPVVGALLDRLVPRGQIELMQELAVQVPVLVMSRILGIPDEHAAWIHEQLRPIIGYLEDPRTSLEGARGARQQLEGVLQRVIGDIQGDGETRSLIGRLAQARAADALSQAEMLQYLLLFLAAGTETTTAAIGNLFVAILTHEGGWQRLRRDPAAIPAVVKESLRWEPPLHTTLRFTTRELQIDGITLPRGAPVQLCLASANRDEDQFDEPERWKPGRPEQTLMSFGAGSHICMGFSLAHKELEVLLELALQRIDDISLEGAGPPVIEGRVFRAPRTLPLRLRPRAAPPEAATGAAPLPATKGESRNHGCPMMKGA